MTEADRALVKRGAAAVAGLSATLSDPGRPLQARVHAARLLGEIGPGAWGAWPALVKAAKDDDAAVRDSAIGALLKVGSRNALGLWSIINNRLEDPDSVVPLLVRQLRDQDQDARRIAAWVLMKRKKPCKEAIAPLIDILEDDDESAPGYAAAALIPNGKAARDAVPLLIPLSFNVRHTAAPYMAIEAIGLDPKFIPAVIEHVAAGSKKNVRSQAMVSWIGVRVLAAAGTDGVPALAKALGHENLAVRLTAALTIQKLGKSAKTDAVARGLAALIANDKTRAEGAAGLVAIGVSAEAAVPGLIKDLESGQVDMMETTELRYTCRAADVLATIPQAVGALLDGLHSDKAMVRIGCLQAMPADAASAKLALPRIKALLLAASTTERDKEWIVKALYRLDPDWVRRAVSDIHPAVGLPARHWRNIVPAVVHAARADAKGK